MKQVRLYHPHDLQGKRISCIMPCPDCNGEARVINGIWQTRKPTKAIMSLDDFNSATGANLEREPNKYIVCPHCEDGTIEIWFYLSDLNHVFKHTAKSILGNIEPAFRDALSNLDRVLQNEITELKCEISNADTAANNNLAALRSDLTQALADHYVALTNTIHDLSHDVSALHTDLTTLQDRTFDQAVLDKADRAISEQDQVINKVFGTKEDDHA